MTFFCWNFNNNEDDESSSSKERFNERLKDYKKNIKFKKRNSEELKFITFFRDVFKIILAMPSVIYSHIKDVNHYNIRRINNDSKGSNFNDVSILKNDFIIKDNTNNDNLISNNNVKKNKKISFLNDNIDDVEVKETNIDIELEIKKKKLQNEILILLKKRLICYINELEIIQSEFYILNEVNSDDLYYNECKDNINNIKRLFSKIKSLKEKYDFLKDNVDFQNILEYDDDSLSDKILELKEICLRDDVLVLVEDYKLMDSYMYLYSKIDKLQEDILKYKDYKLNEIKMLEQRDINFDKLKGEIYNIDIDNKIYNKFVDEQDVFLNQLNEKLNIINSNEVVNYRLKGFGKLVCNSFKYIGLLLANPLKGLIPGIVSQTVATKNVVHNLYNSLELKVENKIVYDTIDYSNEINNALNDLVSVDTMMDNTLDEIQKVKCKLKGEFSCYDSSFASYKDSLSKINKIENSILNKLC